jgi:DNA-binding transcriptional LysR family regulator
MPFAPQPDDQCAERVLNAVRAFGTISFAARRLHVSQAALSQVLAALSKRLGGDVVRAHGGHLRLTAVADRFLGTREGKAPSDQAR